jgi:hypothetical protein
MGAEMTRKGRGKRHSRRPAPVTRLGPKAQAARVRALEALSLMRSRRMSLARAAREAETTAQTVKRYISSALRQRDNGRYLATPSDRLYRELRFLTPDGQITLGVRGSRKASTIARYWAAVDHYLKTGETDALKPFRSKSLKVGKTQHPFITDPRTLERLGNAGEVEFEDLYAVTR